VQQNRIGAWYDNKKSELLLIQREAGANTITVVDSIKALMPHLQESIPPTVKVDLVSDRSLTIRASVDVQWTLLITIALVVMVIFIFLRHVWATIIPSATVPLRSSAPSPSCICWATASTICP
jgi:Cation/multidrug efflux pump